MPKTIKKCFYEKLTFEKFLLAHKRARKSKGMKSEVIDFERNLENNLINLINQIANGTYTSGRYRSFIIYEPKERIIEALPYRDRVVHQWYIEEFIKPYILPRFINSSFACLDDKGTHIAVDTLQKYMRVMKRNEGYFWILKCDIKKYFYNINNDILFNIIQRYIYDKNLLNFSKKVIYTKSNSRIGIPIGNYTSQYFANIYLNELDQFVKRELKIKYYVRYMDDFVILLRNKEECKRVKNVISVFLMSFLKLELNAKSKYYPYKMGIDFCGYRTYTTHRLLRTSNKKKIKKKIKKWNRLWEKNKCDIYAVRASVNAWLGHVSHCNSYRLREKLFSEAKFIYNNI